MYMCVRNVRKCIEQGAPDIPYVKHNIKQNVVKNILLIVASLAYKPHLKVQKNKYLIVTAAYAGEFTVSCRMRLA